MFIFLLPALALSTQAFGAENSSPNSGSTPVPGFQTGNSSGSEAMKGVNQESLNSRRPQGPGNPATEMQRSTALELSFPAGISAITDEMKAKVDLLLGEARRRGQIAQIRVMGWGDVGYPGKKTQVTPEQKSLAGMRAASLEKYIENGPYSLEVDTFNMAERPSALAELMRTSESKMKNTLEAYGLSGKSSDRASKAIVMVIVR